MSVKLGELYYELNIEDQTKKDLSEAKRKVSLWERATRAVVGVSADWTDAKGELKAAGKAVADLDGSTARVRVDGDGSAAEEAIDGVSSAFDDLRATVDDHPIVPTVDVDRIDDGAARGRGSLLDMLGGWKTAAVAAAALGGAAIADKLIEGFNAVLAANQENDRLAASLGLSEGEATVAGRIAGDLWVDAFGESTGQVNEAVRAALLSLPEGGTLGSATSDVKSISEDALNLASIFDVDVTDSIARAAQMVRSGLAPDMTTAFDLIFTGMQRIPSSMTGDMLDAIDEYSTHLAPLGVSGEQIIAMIVNASKDGTIAIDKVGDSLKETGIRLTDMSATSQSAYATIGLNAHDMANDILAGGDRGSKAFQKIVDGLLSIEDPALQSTTAIALFGTPLEDLGGQNIPAFLRSLKTGESGLGKFAGSAKEAGSTLNDNLATDIEEVTRKLSPASLAQAFDQGGIEGVQTRVQEGVDKLKSIWDEYGPAVKEIVSEGLDKLNELWDEKGPEIITALSTWWSESGSPAAGDAIEAALGVAWDGVKAWFVEKVKDPDWWLGMVDDGIVGPFKDAMLPAGMRMAYAATEWLTSLPGIVAEKAMGVWDPIGDGFEAVINHIIDGWNNLSFTLPSFDGLTVGGQEIIPGWEGPTISNPVKIPHVNIPGGNDHQAGPTILGGQHAPPQFAKGGFVDAPVGKAVLAVLHGGEYVNTAADVSQGRTGAPGPRKGAGRRSHGFRDLHVHTGGNPTTRAVAGAVDRSIMGWAG